MQTLEDYRNNIDKVDGEILRLIATRFKIVREIGRHKKEKGLPIVDKERENKKIKELTKRAEKSQISQSFIETVWMAIFKESHNLEQ